MNRMARIGREIEEAADAIVGGMEELATEDPWISLPDDLRLDHLAPLLQLMVRSAAGLAPDSAGPREVVDAALEHGSQRREHGLSEEDLLKEYHLLRSAVWRFLREANAVEGMEAEMLLRLDAEITMATSASLLGYHSGDVGEDRMEAAVRELVRRRREGSLSPPPQEEPSR